MNFQQSLERESQLSHSLGQVYRGGTSGFWGLECLESEWTGVLLKYIMKYFLLWTKNIVTYVYISDNLQYE